MTLPDPRWQAALDHSFYLRQQLNARPALCTQLAEYWQLPISEDLLRHALTPEAADDASLKTQLRQLRQWVMCHLIIRDITGLATLDEVVETMTLLADVTTNHALDFVHRQLVPLYGEPLDSQGRPQRLMVIGMGKLGGRELNVSSDVDYIFVYPENGETAGGEGFRPKKLENVDFFTRLAKRLIAALGEITGDGQVFRVDMRLRPNGDSGPLVCSLDALETYFITQGREWERYAWIKARIMNSGDNAQPEWMEALSRTARPFIFRKYLDFGAINAMRDLHAQIRREVARKDMANHIKLGPGGIREIEFMAQVFQLIRGGRDSSLQIRPTCSVLKRLVARGILAASTEQALRTAYRFLRNLEHRLQYVEDKQTHMLPTTPEAQAQIAISMGFADWAAMMTVLDGHRQVVSQHFDAVFSDPEEGEHRLTALWGGQLDSETALGELGELGYRQPQETWERLERLRQSGRYRQLPASNRERLDAVGPRLLEAAVATSQPDVTLCRGLDFLEIISRRGAYLAMLQQYPQTLRKVADMIGNAAWAAEYLNRHPILLDEFLDPRLLDAVPDWREFREQLEARLAEHVGDTEREMDILREAHHAQVFRLLAQDLAGVLTIERISDHLSELADQIVQVTLNLCWQTVRNRHCEMPKFAVIAYGKMGGKELGYASDLDMVFLYEDEDQSASENYTRLGQRLNTWLSSRTPAGILFETDMRLRPNGDSGLLACSVAAFEQYQQESAWVWEHQALTRARFCAGDPAVGAKFEAIREAMLRRPRDLAALRDDVLSMRQKMRDNLASPPDVVARGEFDLKHDLGGIVDVEFIVQYLVLGYAHQHPALCANSGNIALLKLAGELGLIDPAQAEAVRHAYREYRRLQHAQRLADNPAARQRVEALQPQIAAVRQLWQAVFGSN